jgi:hypothetical protein
MKQSLANFLEVFTDVNKTAIMLILLIVAVLFRIKGYIDGDNLVDLLKTTTISYFGTTTVIHFTQMVKTNLESKIQAALPKDGA